MAHSSLDPAHLRAEQIVAPLLKKLTRGDSAPLMPRKIYPDGTSEARELLVEAIATALRQPDLLDALIELQAASWSRSWRRVITARARVRALTGLDVIGPLRAALQEGEREA